MLKGEYLKVKYCTSPLTNDQSTMANRILTSNLLRDDRLDVSFYSPVECYNIYSKKALENNRFGYSIRTWNEWLRCSLASKEYPKRFVELLNTDIVLFSSLYGSFDIPFIKEMLDSGIKVIVGGNNPNIKHKNLIYVGGYVDLTTDLYKIINDWKDVKITENDFSTFWKCNDDCIDSSQSIFLLNNNCWWRKCRFCTYNDGVNFDDAPAEEIANNILRVGNDSVWIANDYFIFNRKNKEILKILKDNNKHVSIFSGIKLLKNNRYLDNVIEYVDYIKVGVEGGTDFSLSYMNKGYTVDDVYDVFSTIPDITISFNIIVDFPQRNEKEIIKNYETALEWKRILNNVQVVGPSLALFDERCIDGKFIRKTEKATSGRNYIFDSLNIECDNIPFDRYDEDGNILKSDFDIVPENILEELFGNWGWK